MSEEADLRARIAALSGMCRHDKTLVSAHLTWPQDESTSSDKAPAIRLPRQHTLPHPHAAELTTPPVEELDGLPTTALNDMRRITNLAAPRTATALL
jgi:hypothetical protein